MTLFRRSWRVLMGFSAAGLILAIGILLAVGLTTPDRWYQGVYPGGFIHGTNHILQPPFPAFSDLDLFSLNVTSQGRHFYLLGSDVGGRDLLALVAHGAVPSLLLVLLVVAARLIVGFVAGVAIGLGSGPVKALSRGIGSWVIGFPYLAMAIVLIEVLTPHGRVMAFVVAMSIVGWRDVAELVAERIEHVKTQPFSLAAESLGTEGVRFFGIHVMPFLRPLLTIEVAFQMSAVLVLLAELGYLQVYLGPVLRLQQANDNSVALLLQPELGQMLANTRHDVLYRQWEPVLVPALAIASLALTFELLGTALRGRWRVGR